MEVYVTDIEPLRDATMYEKAFELLPAYRKEKASRIKPEKTRFQSIAAGLLLNYAVGRWQNCECVRERGKSAFHRVDMLEVLETNNDRYNYDVVYNECGKPFFLNEKNIFFNLSHSGKFAVCVVSEREVGIDVEGDRKVSSKLVCRHFTEAEIEWLNEGDFDNRFLKIWTFKEAYGKAIGTGVLDILNKIDYKGKKESKVAYDDNIYQDIAVIDYAVDGYMISVVEL